jgi:hypothetical protein
MVKVEYVESRLNRSTTVHLLTETYIEVRGIAMTRHLNRQYDFSLRFWGSEALPSVGGPLSLGIRRLCLVSHAYGGWLTTPTPSPDNILLLASTSPIER